MLISKKTIIQIIYWRVALTKPIEPSAAILGDKYHKLLLQNKQILALVLQICCPEFAGLSRAEIVQRIEPTNPSDRIRGENVELNAGNSKIILDTLTTVDLGSCPMLVNVEVQAKRNPGYSLDKRGTYYIARIISIEKDRGYLKSYDHLQKVYSIWLMVDPPKKLVGTYDMEYAITKRFHKNGTIELLTDDPVQSRFCLVKVYLPEGDAASNDGDPMNILGVLFRNRACYDKTQFAKDNGIPVSQDLSEALMHVRTMEDVIRDDYRRIFKKQWKEEGKLEGKLEGRLEGRLEGKEENSIEIAKRMLKEGCSIEFIKKITQLSTATISKLAQSLSLPAAPLAQA